MDNEHTLTCKNCEQELLGKHCHNCGQTAHVHPMNLHFVWHDIQHGFLNYYIFSFNLLKFIAQAKNKVDINMYFYRRKTN